MGKKKNEELRKQITNALRDIEETQDLDSLLRVWIDCTFTLKSNIEEMTIDKLLITYSTAGAITSEIESCFKA